MSKLIKPVLATGKNRPSINIEVSTKTCFFAFEINGLLFFDSNKLIKTTDKIENNKNVFIISFYCKYLIKASRKSRTAVVKLSFDEFFGAKAFVNPSFFASAILLSD